MRIRGRSRTAAKSKMERSCLLHIKGTLFQIEKTLINDRLCVSELSLKFCIPSIYKCL